jgi:hypothetical protein
MLGESTYGLALEPTTNRDADQFDAKARNELQWLQPGEQRQYCLGARPSLVLTACSASPPA